MCHGLMTYPLFFNCAIVVKSLHKTVCIHQSDLKSGNICPLKAYKTLNIAIFLNSLPKNFVVSLFFLTFGCNKVNKNIKNLNIDL